MTEIYIVGVIFAILGGIINMAGQILQKKVINEIPREKRDKKFMRTLLKSPMWITGIIMIMVGSAIFFIIAQAIIGGALVPGLSASGMIILVIGATKIIGEKIERSELVGIFLCMLGILLIGLSELSIAGDLNYFTDLLFNLRIGVFTGILMVLWFIFRIAGKKKLQKKALYLALAAGIPFAIGNLWLQPFIVAIASLFSGSAGIFEIVVFITCSLFVSFPNILGIKHLQDAFKNGNVSKIAPIQAIPIQVIPVFIYFIVYFKPVPSMFSLIYIVGGIISIIICGFLLSKKQEAMESLK
ncbi:MAG: hypothetical protein ACFFBP_08975 [Promethearchaeota archaeon]